MAEDVAALTIRLQATSAQLTRQLQRSERALKQSSTKMGRNARRLDKRLSAVGSRFGAGIPIRAGAAAAAILGVGVAIRQVVKTGDRIDALENRFTALTGDAERARGKVEDVFDIVASAGGDIDGVAQAMTRFTIATEAIGSSDEQVKEFTENLIKLGQIGGSTTQELTSGAIQLGQGLASGRLAGEELRSVLENLPLVARQIADGLGVGVGKLREMGREGELTTEKVFGAILSGTEDINAQFAELEGQVTIAQQRLGGAYSKLLAKTNQLTGASERWATVLNGIATRMEEIADEAAPAGFGFSDITGSGPLTGVPAGVTNRDLLALYDPEVRAVDSLIGSGRGGDPRNFGFVAPALPTPPAPPAPPGGGGGGGAGAAMDSQIAGTINAIREQVQALGEQKAALGLSGLAAVEYTARLEAQKMVQDAEEEALRAGIELTDAQRAEVEDLASAYVQLTKSIEQQTIALENGRAAMEGIESAFLNSITSASSFTDLIHRLTSALADMVIQAAFGRGALGGLFSSAGVDFGSQVFGAIGGVAGVPGFASGTNYAPGGPALVGEAGPELVTLPRGAKVTPNDQLPGPPKVTIVNNLDPAVVGDYLNTPAGEELIVNVMRRNGYT